MTIEQIIRHNERVEVERQRSIKSLPFMQVSRDVAVSFGYDFKGERKGPAYVCCVIQTSNSTKPALISKEDIKPIFDFLREVWPEAFEVETSPLTEYTEHIGGDQPNDCHA